MPQKNAPQGEYVLFVSRIHGTACRVYTHTRQLPCSKITLTSKPGTLIDGLPAVTALQTRDLLY